MILMSLDNYYCYSERRLREREDKFDENYDGSEKKEKPLQRLAQTAWACGGFFFSKACRYPCVELVSLASLSS